MTDTFDYTESSALGPAMRRERAPAFPIIVAFAVGIALDASLDLNLVFLVASAAGCLLAVPATRQREIRVLGLLAAVVCLGAAAHQRAAREPSGETISRYASVEPRLVRLRGRIADSPVIEEVEARNWARDRTFERRTRCRLDRISLASESRNWHPVGGTVQFTLSGALPNARLGDTIETLGWLRLSGPPGNPGGFDLRAWDKARGIDARLFTEHAGTVSIVPNRVFSLTGSAAAARRFLGRRFDMLLSPDNSAVARAMFLGDRSALSDRLRDSYRFSGAMHVLAISGMHIAILAGFLLIIGRVFSVSLQARVVVIMALIWGYALLTGNRPPIVRAAIFLTLAAMAICAGRKSTLLNTISLAGLLLLVWNPVALFDLGARLSFLAVLGIAWSSRLAAGMARFAGPIDEPPSTSWRWAGNFLRGIVLLELAGLGIWLFTGPVIAGELGLFVPIGLPLNVLLMPLATFVLACGYCVLLICPVSMAAAMPFAFLLENGLWLMNRLVEFAGNIPGGHEVTAPLPTWWLAVWYPLLLTSLLWLRRTCRPLRPLIPLLVWGIVALTAAAPANRPTEMALTMLDVGHGGAILIETPDGQTVLYDCGGMHDDRRAAEIVWNCLRHRGHRRLDALILSHADLDHCNNVPALLRMGRVRTLFVNRTFLNFAQPVVAEACEAAGHREIPIRLVSRGDALRFGEHLRARVLHPPDRPPGEDDNANSLVLGLEYAGRRFLLTGDLEGTGQWELFARRLPAPYDVVIAPHHGGARANTPDFARWTRPKAVLVSCGDRVNIDRVRKTYSHTRRVYFTSRDGAVTVRISPSGTIAFETEVPE